LRRNLIAVNGQVSHRIDPKFYALNILDASEKSTIFKMRRFEKNLIEFEGRVGGKNIIKTFSLPDEPQKTPYCFNLSIQTQGDTRGLSLTSGVPEVEIVSGSSTPAIKYFLRKNQKPVVEKLSLPKT